MPHPDGYFALVLGPGSSRLLRQRYATLPNPIAHHCTVRHGTADPRDLPAMFDVGDLGRSYELVVIGLAASATVEAVAVALILPDGSRLQRGFTENAIAHVTVATDGIAEPFTSNALLVAGFAVIEDGPRLQATLAHVEGAPAV